MSVARGGFKGYWSNIVMPQEIEVQFTVNAADSGGLGVTSVKSNGFVRYVLMHTSATPGVIDGITNPNPTSGQGLLQLKQNYNQFLGMDYSVMSPVTGGTVTTTVNHTAYQINSLGTTTAAQWVAVGLPVGVTAAVGVSFVATASQAIGGTGNVKAIGTSGIGAVELMGNTSLATNSNIATNGGQYLLFQFLNSSGALANPTDTTVVNFNIRLDRSSVTIDGL